MPRADFESLVAARATEKFTHLRVALEPNTDLKEAAERIRVIHNRGLVTDLVMAALPRRPERARALHHGHRRSICSFPTLHGPGVFCVRAAQKCQVDLYATRVR